MNLTRDEMVELLAMVSVLDDRDTDDPLLVDAWCSMAEQGQWESFAAARKALLIYRTEQPNYPLRPGHITQVLERVRRAASESFNPDTERPPERAANDPIAYKQWIHDSAREHHKAAIDAFVAGERNPPKLVDRRPDDSAPPQLAS